MKWASEAGSLSSGLGRRSDHQCNKGLFRTLVVLNLASILEKADEGLLPSLYAEIGLSFHASPTRLATLTLLRRIVQALCFPLAAYMSVRYNRGGVIAFGMVLWAISTFVVGASSTYVEMAISRAVTGIGFAMVLPAIQSLVADTANPQRRGLAFGCLQLTGCIGAFLGTVSAVFLAGTTVFGLAGWRVSFHIFAAASVVVAALVYLLAVDPRRLKVEDPRGSGNTSSALAETLAGAKMVIKIPTFVAIVVQGVAGLSSWSALAFAVMWLESVGFSNSAITAITGSYILSLSLGAVFGGWAGDLFARHLPNTGRIILAQLSSAMGAVTAPVLFWFLPYDSSAAFLHAAVIFVMGFFLPWCATATNSPIYAEIVPEDLRTSIYALDQSFESFFSSFATLLVGILAERVFGYVTPSDDATTVADPQNAAALGKALSVTFGIPSACCCLLYSVLYWTYPKDRDKANLAVEPHQSNDHLNPYVSISNGSDGDGLM